MKKYILTLCGLAAILTACSIHITEKSDRIYTSASGKTVQLNLFRQVKPDKADAYKAAFDRCKQLTMKEDGCMSYCLLHATDDKTLFLIHEEWASQDALDKHSRTSHLKRFIEEEKDMIIRKW